MRKTPLTLFKLLDILNDGNVHSGQDISQRLSISRSAIWKHIRSLKDNGIDVQTIPSKGYRLKEVTVLLDEKKIRDNLIGRTNDLSLRFHLYSTINSTNKYVKSLENYEDKTEVCLAEAQTNGRGRFQREWHSPYAKNIYCSLRLIYKGKLASLSGLSLAVSLAVLDSLSKLGIHRERLSVKWPNDLLVDGKKVCGILVELVGDTFDVMHVVIGIGLNVNMTTAKLDKEWTSLKVATGINWDRNLICGILLATIDDYCNRFNQTGIEGFLSEWHKYDALRGKHISVIQSQLEITGVAAGIDNQGLLLIKSEDGVVHSLSSGETTLKKE